MACHCGVVCCTCSDLLFLTLTKSQNLKKMLELIDTTEEERCPVCQGDYKDFNMHLKHAKFIIDGHDFHIEGVEKCGKCGRQHPYNIPKTCQK